MLTITPQLPQQKAGPLDPDGTLARPWYLYFTAVTSALADFIAGAVYGRPTLLHLNRVTKVTADGTIGEAAFKDTDVTLGATALTHAGAIPKVSSAGTLAESSLTDNGSLVSGTEPLDITGSLRAKSAAAVAPASGKGVEIRYASGTDNGEILAYDRTGAAYKPLVVDGSTVKLQASGSDVGVVSATGVAVTGDVDASGVVKIAGTQRLSSASVEVTTSVKIAGTQVVSTRGAALTAATAAVTGSAVNPYDNTTRDIINNLVTLTTNLRTRVNDIESRMGSASGHGLIT